MENRFLAKAKEGKTEPGGLIGANVLTWGVFFFLGGLPLIGIVLFYSMDDPELIDRFINNPAQAQGLGIPAMAFFIGALLQFPIGMLALWGGTRFVLRRTLKSVVTGFERFRWNRMFIGMGLWALLLTAYMGLLYLKDPQLIRYEGNWEEMLPFLPLALILVPIQCAFEEIAIRGQVLQSFSLGVGFRPIVGLLGTSFFFAFLHSMNPEVETYGWFPMMAQYFTIGAILCFVALMEEGLEMSIGMHIGNNLFSFLILSYPGSVLKTPSIFSQTHIEPWQDFLALLGVGLVIFWVLYGKKKEKWALLR